MKAIMLAAIRIYRRWISPILPGSCRFAPTCSTYAHQALERHGAWKGALLTARRLLRCHPFHPGGYDPVPDILRETEKRGNGEAEIRLIGQLVAGEKDIR
jgi:hypothetical protein